MGSLSREFGNRIRELRLATGLTQEKLAAKADMDYKYLGGVERGERNITMENAERIMRALGVEPFEVFVFGWEPVRSPNDIDERVITGLIRKAEKATRPHIIGLLKHIVQVSRKQ